MTGRIFAVMQYETYRFYDGEVEMMIPSCLKQPISWPVVQNSFVSDNKRVIVNITRGAGSLTQDQIGTRMNEYCRGFARDVQGYECLRVDKRQFLNDSYIDLRYLSNMMGYQFYNAFILGVYGGRELIVTMQCVRNEAAENEHIFDIIADSIRILKKNRVHNV